jgi:hypothetical protein
MQLMKNNARWMLLILLVIALFFWKILFTHQFSLLTGYEAAGQAYSWSHFSASSVQQGILPVWDPNTLSGRSFVGGMETGVFYPLKLFLYLWPLNRSGLFSPKLFHDYYVFTHLLAAWFLFLLARELGLSGFSAFVASLCFSLGGFMARIPWPDMLDSAIWLPLILLFLMRALHSGLSGRGLLYACLTGLALGMSILGGRIHIVLMDGILIVSAAAYFAFSETRKPEATRRPWIHSAVVVAVALAIGLAFGAIQLLPSIEYSEITVRYIGARDPVPARERIPYAYLTEHLLPRAVMAFVLAFPFAGASIGGENTFSPYFGVLPLLLAIIGVWQNWDNAWVRYLCVLAVLVFFYTLGPYTLLHGLVYALVPFLWIARGAARFTYLAHFAMALLAGFGVQALLCREGRLEHALGGLARVLKWILLAVALAMFIPALFGKPETSEWTHLSCLFIVGSCILIIHILKGNRTRTARVLIAVVILCDLNAFYWIIANKIEVQKAGTDYLEQLFRCRSLANWIKAQSGLFRVHFEMDNQPNIGDLYGIQTTGGGIVATELKDYSWFRAIGPRGLSLLNVRFIVRPNTAGEPGPVFDDGMWKVYENHLYYPRAWIVHQVEVESSTDKIRGRILDAGFDPLRLASVSQPLEVQLEPGAPQLNEEVKIDHYQADRIDLSTRAQSRGLLVLSEVHYPGWQAQVNGQPTPIHKVNGLLRGIVVPGGASKVEVRYRPGSILLGAVLSGLAVLVTAVLAAGLWLRVKRARAGYLNH